MKVVRHTLFSEVVDFYTHLLATLCQAKESIHMVYFAFDSGEWAEKISSVLQQKAHSGVAVHLLVDEVGMAIDNPRNFHPNRALISRLRSGGVQVDLFRPLGRRLSQFNRLHVKFCALDEATVFMGGSNIGDHYLGWRDSNICLEGEFGDTFPRIYRYLRQFSSPHAMNEPAHGDQQGELPITDTLLLFNVPGQRLDIRRKLLDLILEAERSVTIRSWYFLPDQEILNALLSQAERRVDVTVMFSERTRVPLIDIASRFAAQKLNHLASMSISFWKGICTPREHGTTGDTSSLVRPTLTRGRWAKILNVT